MHFQVSHISYETFSSNIDFVCVLVIMFESLILDVVGSCGDKAFQDESACQTTVHVHLGAS